VFVEGDYYVEDLVCLGCEADSSREVTVGSFVLEAVPIMGEDRATLRFFTLGVALAF
jgi:hypothetical protein